MRSILQVLLAVALALTDGKSLENNRLRGDPAPQGYMPYLGVAILSQTTGATFDMQDANICSVILVSPKWVLTSTNCLLDVNSPVYFGSNKWCSQASYGEDHSYDFDIGYKKSTIKKLVEHPKYNEYGSRTRSSLQLAQLNEDIPLSPRISVAEFGKEDIAMGRDFFNVSGWGQFSIPGSPSCYLKKMSLPVFGQESCDTYGASNLRSDEFCAGDTTGKSYTCSMDAGSPLVKEGKVYGLVSYNTDCSRTHPVGVYLNLYTYRNWITKTIGQQ